MQCTVYARNFTSVGPGQVKLVRVAQFPIEAGEQGAAARGATAL